MKIDIEKVKQILDREEPGASMGSFDLDGEPAFLALFLRPCHFKAAEEFMRSLGVTVPS